MSADVPLTRICAGAAQTSCVAVVHDVVAHGWPVTYADGLWSAVPKYVPRMVSAASRETGALSGEKDVKSRHDSDANVGYSNRSVAPHASYTLRLLQLESAVVESKADAKEVTLRTFQLARFWLKAAAPLNIESMLLTFAVFQAPRFWLNAVADWNM